MLTLQNTLQYQGDPARLALKQIALSFSLPRYDYTIAPASHDAWVDRTALGPVTCDIVSALAASDYRMAFPATAVTGDDPATVANFWRYAMQAWNGGTTDGAAAPGRPAPLEQLTVPVTVRHLTPDGIGLGQQQWDALLTVGMAAGAAHPVLAGATPGKAERDTGAAAPALDADSLVLVNKAAYLDLLKELGGTTRSGDDAYLLTLVGYLCDTSSGAPALAKKIDPALEKLLLARLREHGSGDPAAALALTMKRFAGLFDFPVRIAQIVTLDVAGTLRIVAADQAAATKADFSLYDVVVAYTSLGGQGQVGAERHVDWQQNHYDVKDNALSFDLAGQAPLYRHAIAGTVQVAVKGFDGALLWSRQFDADDKALAALVIDVPLLRPIKLQAASKGGTKDAAKKIRGQVLAADATGTVAGLTVLVQAQQGDDPAWRIVSAGTTDKSGNFSLPYPYGAYAHARALLPVAPDAPADIAIVPDDGSGATVSDAFLYLLLKDAPPPQPDADHHDCDCAHPKKAPRLPDQADLIDSDDYTQDIGGACVNLSTPNRTLSEYGYMAIVRTSDPDVANYTLKKIETWVPKLGQKMTTFELTGGAAKIARKSVDLGNPVRWQDAPDDHANLSLYQAVTIATGHVLHYKSVFKADGYSLGELLYSLALAPGQKKEIVVFDATHSLQAEESQAVSQRESLSAGLVDDRQILDQLGGSINEAMRGSSSAHTSGVSAGLGAGAMVGPVGAVLGVSGGTANSSSSAQQNSARGVSQFFSEKLRQSIMQNAASYRQMNASVVTTVSEGQRYAATTEVVANHNHCHALTMMYFEVLRHYAIYQELSNVEECVFVPLLMTDFSAANIYKWRDVLAANLLYMPSETYLRHRGSGYVHPLLKGFDASERIRTDYANVDFPAGRYDEESIDFIRGEIQLKTNLQRPRTRYDRIKSLPIVTTKVSHEEAKGLSTAEVVGAIFTGFASLLGHSDSKTVTEEIQVRAKIFDVFMQIDDNFQTVPPAHCIRVTNFRPTSVTIGAVTVPVTFADFFENDIIDKKLWTTYATLLGYDDVIDMMENYFQGRLIAEWDDIYNNEIAPVIFDKMVDTLRIDEMALDFSSATRYKGGERIMRVNLRGTTSKRRIEFPLYINIFFDSELVKGLRDLVTVDTGKVAIYYDTAHYHGTLFSGYVNDELLDGTQLHIPENSDEKRNPRMEDIYVVNKLISHLNSNLEHYNKALWFSLDADRRYMLLDGFNIQVFDAAGAPVAMRSLASVVKNELLTITGNAMVFPVAAGYKVSQSYITETAQDGSQDEVSLMDHYQPLTPVPPYRISVPSRGVFAEAVQGSCNACEKIETDRLQDWQRYPNTDEPTAFMPVTPPTPTVTDWKAAFKDLAQPLVNIQTAPAAPAPGAGLAGLSELLGKGDVFRDITGLEGNQKNVMATYQSNQDNAKAFAQMAKEMTMQAHATEHADKIMDSLKAGKGSGALSQAEYAKLVKAHLQQLIDGGAAARAEAEAEKEAKQAKPTLTDAAVKAVEQGKDVKAHSINGEGRAESVDISGSGKGKIVLAKVTGVVPRIKQNAINVCWATVATMMVNWQRGKDMLVQEVMDEAGALYLQKFMDNQTLASGEKAAFLAKLKLVGEPSANYALQQYVDWVRAYGPLWVTTAAKTAKGEFGTHARILTKIVGSGDPADNDATLTFIDPGTGNEATQTFRDFIHAFEQVITEDDENDLYIQIVHFEESPQPMQP